MFRSRRNCRSGGTRLGHRPETCRRDRAFVARAGRFFAAATPAAVALAVLAATLRPASTRRHISRSTPRSSTCCRGTGMAAERDRARPGISAKRQSAGRRHRRARTATLSTAAARSSRTACAAEPQLFRYVRQPDGGPFFDKQRPAVPAADDLQATSDKLIAAQPLIGSMASGPEPARPVRHAGAVRRQRRSRTTAIAQLDPTLPPSPTPSTRRSCTAATPLSWQRLMTGREPDRASCATSS